jgi:galactokinase
VDAARAAIAGRAAGFHRASFGANAETVAVAPGRINIIGEHTDYAGGLCLPAAVDRYLAVAASRSARIEAASEQYPGDVVRVEPDQVMPTGGWGDHPLGVLAELVGLGAPIGVRLAIVSDIPPGSGLSSSAALGVATAMAAAQLAGWSMDPLDLARLCRRAENDFLGVPSGLMDQAAVVLGREDTALLFDAGAEIAEPVPLPPNFGWLVIQSGIERSLRGSGYGDRRAEAEGALEAARERHRGLRTLCDLDPTEVEALSLPAPLDRRARHIAGECVRVRMAVACIEAGNIEALGQLVLTSHKSLARDYEVSLPDLDRIVDIAVDAGCAGARVMGAGFGGSVLAVVDAETADTVAVAIRERFQLPAGAAGRGGGEVHRLAVVDGAAAAEP